MISQELITKYINHCRYKEDYAMRTLQEYKSDLEFIYFFLCKKEMGEDAKYTEEIPISEDAIKEYIFTCRKKKINDYSINRKISALNGYLNYINHRYQKQYEKIKIVAAKKKTKYVYLKKAERELLIQGLGQKQYFRNKAIILLILNTGIKVKHLYHLNYNEDILNEISVNGVKSRTPHVVAVALRDYFNNERGWEAGPLFLSLKGTRLTPRSIERMLNKASECAGLFKSITPELLRQTYISQLAMEGLHEGEIREKLNLKERLDITEIKYI